MVDQGYGRSPEGFKLCRTRGGNVFFLSFSDD